MEEARCKILGFVSLLLERVVYLVLKRICHQEYAGPGLPIFFLNYYEITYLCSERKLIDDKHIK